MEKVLVVKEVPGMLKIGDVLISYTLGGDFILEEKVGNNERYVSIDYVTVCDNMPEYFDFILELKESVPLACDCDECTCECDCVPAMYHYRSPKEIEDRQEFFQRQVNESVPGSEAEVVYTNLIWFIEWLKGEKNLLKF